MTIGANKAETTQTKLSTLETAAKNPVSIVNPLILFLSQRAEPKPIGTMGLPIESIRMKGVDTSETHSTGGYYPMYYTHRNWTEIATSVSCSIHCHERIRIQAIRQCARNTNKFIT